MAITAILVFLTPQFSAFASDHVPGRQMRYVSTVGSDANTCEHQAPCRSLQRGIEQTPTGGELRILDSGFYDETATVTKSITISGRTSRTLLSHTSFKIDAPDASVGIKNLRLSKPAGTGIHVASATDMLLENIVVSGAAIGVALANGLSTLVLAKSTLQENGRGLVVSKAYDVSIEDCRFTANAAEGVSIQNVSARILNSRFSSNDVALRINGSANIDGSKFLRNKTGIIVLISAIADIRSSVMQGNLEALNVTSSAVARLSNVSIVRNATGIVSSGTVQADRTNSITGNTTDIAGSGALVAFNAL